MALYSPTGQPIQGGNVEDPLKKKSPIGGGPVGVQTPIRQPSVPITGGQDQYFQPGGNMPDPTRQPSIPITDSNETAGNQRGPISPGGPVGVQQAPAVPAYDPRLDPRNIRARQAREEAAQQQPNTAQLLPGQMPQQAPVMGGLTPIGGGGKGPIINRGYGRMYPRNPEAEARRRYFG